MLKDFLIEQNTELYTEVVDKGIDLTPFEDIYRHSNKAAINALREVLKTQVHSNKERLSHVQQFKRDYSDDIAMFIEAHDQLLERIEEYREKKNVRIVIDYEAEDGDIIKLGRAKRGTKKKNTRDLAILYEYLKSNGVSFDMRISPNPRNESLPYQYGELLSNGNILVKDKQYTEARHWSSDVYAKAVKDGLRDTPVGSPYKGIQVKTKRDQWVTLDKAWYQALEWYNTIEEEEDEEE